MLDINPCTCGNTLCGVSHRFRTAGTRYFVICPLCGKEGLEYPTTEDAILDWNNSSSQQKVDASLQEEGMAGLRKFMDFWCSKQSINGQCDYKCLTCQFLLRGNAYHPIDKTLSMIKPKKSMDESDICLLRYVAFQTDSEFFKEGD